MAQAKFHFSSKGNFLAGEFNRPVEPQGEWISRSPADLTDELGKFQYSYASVDHAVRIASESFKKWRKLAFAERAEFLKKYQARIKAREEEFAEAIAREVGKPLWEAKTEVSAMVNKVDITINDSSKFVADFEIPKIMDNTLGATRFRPLGVMAVIGPFNFPGHLANGHIVPALLTGNTVIFKPSEKSPQVGQLMAECFQEAGFPAGVFNLIQGEKEVGRRLCVHEGVAGVLFTGSYEVGTRIKQDTLLQHWKLLALEMGGKNASIVWEDANLNLALHETLVASYQTTGQRCSSTSRILVHRKIFDRFVEQFHQRAKAFSIGHPLDNPFMGSLIDQPAVDRYLKFLGIAVREGFEMVMRGKSLEGQKQGYYVAPSICTMERPTLEATKKSVYQQTELFAPNVAILAVDSIQEAIDQANETQYGLVASVFTAQKDTYKQFWDGLCTGLINWNKSTSGASSKLPFGGLKKSGNHLPTALLATQYCTYPVASLETEEVKTFTPLTGLNWPVEG